MGLLPFHCFCADILGCLHVQVGAGYGMGTPNLALRHIRQPIAAAIAAAPNGSVPARPLPAVVGLPCLGGGTLESDRPCSILAPHPSSGVTVGNFPCHSVPRVLHRVMIDPA